MGLLFFIVIVCLIVIAAIIVWRRSDWKSIDKYNKNFNENGNHIYYDREIIEKNNNEEHKC